MSAYYPPPSSGNFDPNEVPVIIGNGATAGAGTPDNPAGGTANATVVGPGSSADGLAGSAYGHGAVASGDFSVAFGDAAEALGTNSVAIGPNTLATHDDSIIVGVGISSDSAGQLKVGNGSQTAEFRDGFPLLASPDATQWQMTVANDGTLGTVSV